VRSALASGNDEYERRFGHTFILCATGLDAAQMLAALEQRMTNDAATERDATARELHKITRLRLEKLLAGS
jgi:2-oxo-4-hydroxy-4-carboxy-5-ureidoimidazoline decarboxylase